MIWVDRQERHSPSWLAGEPHDGDLAVGLLLVRAIAWCHGGDAGERVGPLRPLQAPAADLEPLFADFQPDVIGMLGHVEEPGWVVCCSAKRGDDEPGVVSVWKASDRVVRVRPVLAPRVLSKTTGKPILELILAPPERRYLRIIRVPMGLKSFRSGFGIRVPRVPGGLTRMAMSVTSSCVMRASRSSSRPPGSLSLGRLW